MKRIIIAAVTSTFGGAALAGGPAEPVAAPVVVAPAAAVHDWSGFYGGLQVGGMDGNLRLNGVNLNSNETASSKFGVSGPALGLFAGYNWTQGPILVYGIEGELNLASVDGSGPGVPPPASASSATGSTPT